ncbi:hypothetical protein VTN02DRAFT_2683 [Thermoascus thermophilus]
MTEVRRKINEINRRTVLRYSSLRIRAGIISIGGMRGDVTVQPNDPIRWREE